MWKAACVAYNCKPTCWRIWSIWACCSVDTDLKWSVSCFSKSNCCWRAFSDVRSLLCYHVIQCLWIFMDTLKWIHWVLRKQTKNKLSICAIATYLHNVFSKLVPSLLTHCRKAWRSCNWNQFKECTKMNIKSKMKVSTAIKTDLHDADLLGVECLFPCLLAAGVTGGVGVGAEPT